MAYCSNCGAYVADGLEKCPACGRSTRERKSRERDAWDVHEDDRRASGGFEAQERREYEYSSRSSAEDAWEQYGRPRYTGRYRANDGVSTEQRILGALCYVSWLFIVPLILRRYDPFVRHHLNQGVVMFIVSCLSWLVGILGGLINVVIFFMCCAGFIGALSGKYTQLPVVSGIQLFK